MPTVARTRRKPAAPRKRTVARKTASRRQTASRRRTRKRRYRGGSFWSWIKKAGKTAFGLTKKHKLLSKGLAMSKDPRLKAAAGIASMLGLGYHSYHRKRITRRRGPVRGRGLKLAGAGHHRGCGINP